MMTSTEKYAALAGHFKENSKDREEFPFTPEKYPGLTEIQFMELLIASPKTWRARINKNLRNLYHKALKMVKPSRGATGLAREDPGDE